MTPLPPGATCTFEKSWVGPCKAPAIGMRLVTIPPADRGQGKRTSVPEPRCEDHIDARCLCGAPANGDCGETVGPLCCGAHMCPLHPQHADHQSAAFTRRALPEQPSPSTIRSPVDALVDAALADGEAAAQGALDARRVRDAVAVLNDLRMDRSRFPFVRDIDRRLRDALDSPPPPDTREDEA